MLCALDKFRKSAEGYIRGVKGIGPPDSEDLLSEMTVIFLEKGHTKFLSRRFCYLQASNRLYPRRGVAKVSEAELQVRFDTRLTPRDIRIIRNKLESECTTVYFAMLILGERLARVEKKSSLRDSNMMWDYFVEGLTLADIAAKWKLSLAGVGRILVKSLEWIE